MAKIRHLRLCRPGEREGGIGREELAFLLGEREPKNSDRPQAASAPENGRWPDKKIR